VLLEQDATIRIIKKKNAAFFTAYKGKGE
jgi:hypothetical protein